MAIGDAWQLAEQLLNPEHQTLDDVIKAYDAESIPRSTRALMGGRMMIGTCHRKGIKYVLTVVGLWCVGWIMRVSGWWLAGPAQGKLWP